MLFFLICQRITVALLPSICHALHHYMQERSRAPCFWNQIFKVTLSLQEYILLKFTTVFYKICVRKVMKLHALFEVQVIYFISPDSLISGFLSKFVKSQLKCKYHQIKQTTISYEKN